MSKRRVPYPPGAPLNEGGYPALDSNGRPTPWTRYRAYHLQETKGSKSSRAILRESERAAVKAKVAAEAAALRASVLTAYRPPAGKILAVDVAGLIVIGPNGGIGVTPLLARTMVVLATPGRHTVEEVVNAGWRDAAHLREGLEAFAGKLTAIGLQMSQRKTGLRITKAKG